MILYQYERKTVDFIVSKHTFNDYKSFAKEALRSGTEGEYVDRCLSLSRLPDRSSLYLREIYDTCCVPRRGRLST